MTRGVRWYSIPPGSGFGTAASDYMSGLRSAGVPVTWTVLGWPSTVWPGEPYGPVTNVEVGDSPHRDVVDAPVGHDVVVMHSSPLWHERLGDDADGKLLAAYTTWETDRLPEESVAILNRFDRVFVPSRFNRTVFEGSGVKVPISVVPHIARDTASLDGLGTDSQRAEESRFVFYLIATWTTRKAIPDTVEAFLRAFDVDDPVTLKIHTTKEDLVAGARHLHGGRSRAAPETRFSLARALSGRHRVPDIVLSTGRLDREAVDEIHRTGDCFVSLSRGEGFGLGAFEAAAFGRPAIVTGWGGTPEFLPEGYPYLVDFSLVPTTDDEPDQWWWPRPGERWAKADVECAATLMRQVFETREVARSWGRRLRTEVTSKYDGKRVTTRLLEAMKR